MPAMTMRMPKGFGWAVAALGLMAGAAGRAEATLAVQFSGADASGSGSPASIGFSFTTNSAVDVTALDFLTPGALGGDVRLYNAAGTTLASATVLATDPTESTGGFTYNVHAIAPLELAANTTYYVAGDIPAETENVPVRATGLTTAPAITYGAGVLQFPAFGNPTTDQDGAVFNPAYFTVNFDLSPALATPEPATIVPASIAGLIGLGYARRRRSKAAA
jgi:hypothetical protein